MLFNKSYHRLERYSRQCDLAGRREDVVARNKRPQAADEKRAEIVGAARRLFIDAGYDATSMSRLAREAGVAPNTIYWYFGDKDDVLIAVLTAVMADVWPQYQDVASEPISARLLWNKVASVSATLSPGDDLITQEGMSPNSKLAPASIKRSARSVLPSMIAR